MARERVPGEARVALVPEVVGKLKAAGYAIAVEPDAGRLAMVPDEAYAAVNSFTSEVCGQTVSVWGEARFVDRRLVRGTHRGRTTRTPSRSLISSRASPSETRGSSKKKTRRSRAQRLSRCWGRW